MKRHLLTIGGGLAGIALTAAVLVTGASVIEGRQSTEARDFSLETPDMADVPDLGGGMNAAEAGTDETLPINPAPGIAEPQAVRDIAPETFALPQDVTAQPLERIEPRTPLSQPVARPEPVPSVLRHPIALSAGLIQFGDRMLQLDGIEPEKPDRICGEPGKTWPCGVVAKTAFRNFLRARALLCIVPKNGWQGTLTATCSINDTDPAAWLAENGWANVPAGSPLAGKAASARQSRLGFFGDDPRDVSTTPPLPDDMQLPGDADTGIDMPDQAL